MSWTSTPPAICQGDRRSCLRPAAKCLHRPFLGYFRNVYIFGQEYTIAKALTKITGGVTFVNSVASTVCVVILYLALRPALERANLLPKAQKASEPKTDK